MAAIAAKHARENGLQCHGGNEPFIVLSTTRLMPSLDSPYKLHLHWQKVLPLEEERQGITPKPHFFS